MSRAYCVLCGTHPRSSSIHVTTKQHRTATRPKSTRPWNKPVGRPSWALSLARDPLAGTPAEEDAAMRRLEAMT